MDEYDNFREAVTMNSTPHFKAIDGFVSNIW